jgi:hypothetical protein
MKHIARRFARGIVGAGTQHARPERARRRGDVASPQAAVTALSRYCTFSNSTSKISVAPGGIAPLPAPLSP